MNNTQNEMETLFYDMQRDLYDEWSEVFQCDTDSKFVACQRRLSGPHYHTPPIVTDNETMGVLCLTILEKCMDSEKEYPCTFWVECMRICLYREFVFEIDQTSEKVFDSFVAFMLGFNATYPLTLPSIFHSTLQMHKACQFFMPRVDKNESFYMHVLTTDILLKYNAEEIRPVSIHEPDEERDLETDSLTI